jgi:adenylosuccinate synthase
MKNLLIVGTQWGDEGKGKVVDLLTPKFDIVVRYQGGHNAGHTVIVGKDRFILRLIPSGILHPDKTCVIGNGVVLDAVAFQTEIAELQAANINVNQRLWVSNRAHLILPYHRALDIANEIARGDNKVGTTQRGIGPAYTDKISRQGLRVADAGDFSTFRQRTQQQLTQVRQQLAALDSTTLNNLLSDAEMDRYYQAINDLQPYVQDTAYYLYQAANAQKAILLEGAQGTMLDIDHGTFPFVTSSSPTVGGALTGSGLSADRIHQVLGITKAYTTRVGAGPFPTELHDDTGEYLRQQGQEFGAVTGRPRRIGWFDAAVVRYSAMLNGLTGLAITKLDVLDTLPVIKIGIGYQLHGKNLATMPATIAELAQVTPIYETWPGWQTTTAGITEFTALPAPAQAYLQRLAELVACPIALISTGPARESTLLPPQSFLQS